ncbi:hypothetical protein NE237_030227 [Protea cynaroides]|uniref:Protein ABIL2 n=1 Tax=Protea cynaroides TaxID=273540 RepID=A0A9Q0GVS1_9MAGN|nr:hypothetical protein NE237_030227 [Protea cynaroides]
MTYRHRQGGRKPQLQALGPRTSSASPSPPSLLYYLFLDLPESPFGLRRFSLLDLLGFQKFWFDQIKWQRLVLLRRPPLHSPEQTPVGVLLLHLTGLGYRRPSLFLWILEGRTVHFLPSRKKMPSSSASSVQHESSTYDEQSMQQSLLFSDSLKDLKNLRTQLYSAAEYFELSYTNDDQKQMVMDMLKDYAVKALVNTVDHLGSVTFKVNGFLDEKVDEVLGTELRVSCIEQRLRTCQTYIDLEGLSQQSLVIPTPNYHKRYILPVGETMRGSGCAASKYQGSSLDNEVDRHHFKNAVQATIRETPSLLVRKGCSPSPSQRPSQPGTFSFTEKRTVSPPRSSFPLLRSGSLISRPANALRSQTTMPTSNNARRQYPSQSMKLSSVRLPPEKDSPKENEHNPSKSKRLLKSLLSRRKSKKDDMLYTYLDEY